MTTAYTIGFVCGFIACLGVLFVRRLGQAIDNRLRDRRNIDRLLAANDREASRSVALVEMRPVHGLEI